MNIFLVSLATIAVSNPTTAFTNNAFVQRNQLPGVASIVTHPSFSRSVGVSILKSSQTDNPFSSFVSSLFPAQEEKAVVPEETPEEKARRLELERRAKLAEGEVLRQGRVKEDALPYLFLLALQGLPLLGTERIFSAIYFLGLAVTTVYVGGRQVTLDEPDLVSEKNALYAPVGASFAIGILYLLLKVGIDPTGLYAIGATLFGAFAISDVAVPILRNVLPESFAKGEVEVPEPVAKALKLDPPTLPVDGLSTLAMGFFCAAIYLSPVALAQKFLVSNLLAWALAMVSLGAISLGSFQTGALLLGGLFFYDIFWVFGTDVMMTVATKVEAPIKFLYTAPPTPEPKGYPFSVLGLGDVVIPGIFVRFMSELDKILKPQNFSYFNAAALAYGVGLTICFGVNEITHAGQPALLYLDPACVGSALACGAANGQLEEVWNFAKEEEDSTDNVQP
mmetsp:Transcript_13301/g.18845  ORF Transcript_13301/g.18845 Transcript_13301/m.18845 type:complete len:450 (-) Transcript_13301:424-1773(-)